MGGTKRKNVKNMIPINYPELKISAYFVEGSGSRTLETLIVNEYKKYKDFSYHTESVVIVSIEFLNPVVTDLKKRNKDIQIGLFLSQSQD